MKSMTGYGKSAIVNESFDLQIEIKSVNYKSFDLKMNNAKELFFLENEIKETVFTYIKRGKIDLKIIFSDKRLPIIEIDENRLKTYYNLLCKVKETLKIQEEIKLDTIINAARK